MQGCKVKDQILQKVMKIVVIKLQKEMEGMVILHLFHLHLPLILLRTKYQYSIENPQKKYSTP
jgi:hypothetical protein